MALDVTVCVATFGDDEWKALAEERAVPSAENLGVPWLHCHDDRGGIHDARNEALSHVVSEFVCFLDADDELEAGYFDHIETATADIRVPSVRYVKENGFGYGVIMPTIAGHTHVCEPECLRLGNYIVIGAVAPTQLLKDVGGFRDFPWSEDWDLWVRCWKAGATFENVPLAVYRAHVRSDSRNRGKSQAEKHAAHQMIAEANGLPVPA